MSSELQEDVSEDEPIPGSRPSQRSQASYPQRVFIDATYTLVSGRCSGIERVVTNLRQGCVQRAIDGGAQAATLMSLGGEFYEVGAQEKEAIEDLARAQSHVLSSLPAAYRSAMRVLIRSLGSPRKLKKWFLPDPGHLGAFKLPYRFWYKRVLKKICSRTRRVQPSRGDLLILPDAYWARKEIWPAAQAARSKGAFVAVVVYDLIPLSHPEFVGSRRTQRFEEYLRQVARHADIILTISDTVRRELVETLPEIMGGEAYCQNITPFPLGSEFPQSHGQPRAELVSLFSDVDSGDLNAGNSEFSNSKFSNLTVRADAQKPYLTVAAFDPRKNHRYLLDAFDAFWEQFPERKLCLVGRTGSRCQDILQRIEHHPRLGRQLFAFHDLSDAELQYCYRKCQGVIFPSIVEGFGLPIVEALWHGQRTLASDTPIHREVGGGDCQYFDLASPGSLVDLLVGIEQAPHSVGRPSAQCNVNGWSECTDTFYDKCLEAFYRIDTSLVPLDSRRAGIDNQPVTQVSHKKIA